MDYESYFDRRDYSVVKMGTEPYIRDARFEAHGCAIKTAADRPAVWIPRPYLKQAFAAIDWAGTFAVAHHNHFDGLISSHHYGVVPRMYGCTLSMARLILGNHLSVSLEAVRQHFGMPTKQTPYGLFEGRHWDELSPAVQHMVGEGACDEVESVWKIFHLLLKQMPVEELELIDSTVRMFTQPLLIGDGQVFADVWRAEQVRRQQTFERLGLDIADLQSADRFAELLRQHGIEPEKKPGKPNVDGTEKLIYAFAKTDPQMEELLLDEDEDVRALVEARLGAKSTLLGTRAETLGWAASRGRLPVYLNYCGAHTTRWSGGDGCLTADTQVLALDIHGAPTYKKIVDVLASDLVWDGEEFVEHDGVAFRGYQEVIFWDGINGTPEHPVFCGEAWKSLCEALQAKAPIMDCREPTAWEVEAARTRRRSSSQNKVRVRVRKQKNSDAKRPKKRKIESMR